MRLESKLLKETILGLIDRGADIVRIGKAAQYNELSVSELQEMNKENGLVFEYNSSADMLVISKDQS